jgi:hypothetical protein
MVLTPSWVVTTKNKIMERLTVEKFNIKMNACIEAFRGVTQPGGSSIYWDGMFKNAEAEMVEIAKAVKVNWPDGLYFHFNNIHRWYMDNTDVIENRINFSAIFYTPPVKKPIPGVYNTVGELLADKFQKS